MDQLGLFEKAKYIAKAYTVDQFSIPSKDINLMSESFPEAITELNLPVICGAVHWVLVGEGNKRYLISEA